MSGQGCQVAFTQKLWVDKKDVLCYTVRERKGRTMSNVYVLYYHGDEFYALVDSAWTAAKMLVGEWQVDEDSILVANDRSHAGKYRTLGELMKAYSKENQIVDVVAELLKETAPWSLMAWRLEEQTLWTKEDYGG